MRTLGNGLVVLRRLYARITEGDTLRVSALIANTNALLIVLDILASLMIVRYLAKDIYGFYQVMLSSLGLLEVFFVGYDTCLVRFLPTEEEERPSLLLSVTLIKALVAAGIVFLSIPIFFLIQRTMNVPPTVGALAVPVFVLCVMTRIAATANTTASSTLLGLRQFHSYSRIQVFRSAALLLASFLVVDLDLGFIPYLVAFVLVYVVSILWMANLVERAEPGLLRGAMSFPLAEIPGRVRRTFNRYLKAYGIPLEKASILQYFKTSFPILVLGVTDTMVGVAVFTVIRNMFEIVHKFVPGVLEAMIPQLVKRHKDDRGRFINETRRIIILYLGYTLAMGGILLVAKPLVIQLLALPVPPELDTYFVLVMAEFFLGAAAQVSILAIKLSEDTGPMFASALRRVPVDIILTPVLASHFGILGAGASLLLAKMISTASLYYDSIRLGLYTRSTYLRYILVVTLVIATLFIHYWRA